MEKNGLSNSDPDIEGKSLRDSMDVASALRPSVNLADLKDANVTRVDNRQLSTIEKAGLVASSAFSGLINEGGTAVTEHPWRLAAEGAGAYAMTLAMKGPNWTKVPAMGVAAIGGAAYTVNIMETAGRTSELLAQVNQGNKEQVRAELEKTVGPLAFETAFMGLTGGLAAKHLGKIPSEPPPAVNRFVNETAQTLRMMPEVLTGNMGPRPAFAGIGPGLNMAESKAMAMASRHTPVERPNVMAMSTDNMSGGSRIFSGRGVHGEVTHRIDNIRPSETLQMEHSDGTRTIISGDGNLQLFFPSQEGRMLNLGQPIRNIVAGEFNGVRQYRVNGSPEVNLEIAHQGHSVKAVLGNGDHVHMMDNAPGGNTFFQHRDGSKTWVEYNGRMVFQLPKGSVQEHQLGSQLANIRLVERPNGSKEFRFLDAQGAPVRQVVEIPPVREDDGSQLASILKSMRSQSRQAVSRADAPFEVHRYEPGVNGVARPQHRPDSVGSMVPRGAASLDRIMDRHIAGVPTKIMRGDDLDTPASMGLAQQGHSWLLTKYLARLNGNNK